MKGVDGEIAVIRCTIAAIANAQPQNDRLLQMAMSSLARLLRTKEFLEAEETRRARRTSGPFRENESKSEANV